MFAFRHSGDRSPFSLLPDFPSVPALFPCLFRISGNPTRRVPISEANEHRHEGPATST